MEPPRKKFYYHKTHLVSAPKKEDPKAKARQAAKKEEPDGDAEKWSVDTSAAAVEARRRELLGTRDRLTQKEGEEEEETAGCKYQLQDMGLM